MARVVGRFEKYAKNSQAIASDTNPNLPATLHTQCLSFSQSRSMVMLSVIEIVQKSLPTFSGGAQGT